MNKMEEFKRAYDDYPSQDNEGYVPDRGGFKSGFFAAWDLLSKEMEKIKAERDAARAEIERLRAALMDARSWIESGEIRAKIDAVLAQPAQEGKPNG